MPQGKKIDEKLTPNKHIKVLNGDTESKENSEQEVIEVFTVNVTEHVENVKRTSEERIKQLNDLIDSLDKSNVSVIAQITAQIGQIEIARDTSICSMQSNTSSDIKIEKQRFCPAWT